ncbi:integrator complex subunit 3-like [Schistocerca gregaria]|uniref:integrator complex subunit 3-like n=1 Tax=Schistocerca gregaria TaxID=7010 RepID=UPI00211E6FC1|nr:integrator complex subunit 3-like [Schistocerca gregaria]
MIANIPKLISSRKFDRVDELEQEWQENYVNVLEKCKDKAQQQVTNILVSAAMTSNEEHANITTGLIYGILVDRSSAYLFLNCLGVLTRDKFSHCVSQMRRLILERYSRLEDSIKEQCVWLVIALITLGAPDVDRLVAALLRYIVTGSTQKSNIWLIQQILSLLTNYKDWFYEQTNLIPVVLYTLLSVIGDHTKSQFDSMREREVELCVRLLREKFDLCKLIGRDLIRILYNVLRIPELEKVWKDVIMSNQTPSTPYLRSIYFTPTPKHILTSRITPEAEHWLRWMMHHVRAGNQKRYQIWFSKRHFASPESEALIPELIRWVCGAHHPSNAILQSDIVPRWAILGWLLTSIKTPYIATNAKQALFYDWLFFVPNKDNIMNVEPAMLLMMNSLNQYVDITIMLGEFLFNAVESYIHLSYQPIREDIRRGILNSAKIMLDKKVISSLDPLLNCPQIPQSWRDAMKKLLDVSSISPNGQPRLPYPQQAIPMALKNRPVQGGLAASASNISDPSLPPSNESNANGKMKRDDLYKKIVSPHPAHHHTEQQRQPKRHSIASTSTASTQQSEVTSENDTAAQVASSASKEASSLTSLSEPPRLDPNGSSNTSNTDSRTKVIPPKAPSSTPSDQDDESLFQTWKAAVFLTQPPSSSNQPSSAAAPKSQVLTQSKSPELVEPYRNILGQLSSAVKVGNYSLARTALESVISLYAKQTSSDNNHEEQSFIQVAEVLAESLITVLSSELLDCSTSETLPNIGLPLQTTSHSPIHKGLFGVFGQNPDSASLLHLLTCLRSIEPTYGYRYLCYLIESQPFYSDKKTTLPGSSEPISSCVQTPKKEAEISTDDFANYVYSLKQKKDFKPPPDSESICVATFMQPYVRWLQYRCQKTNLPSDTTTIEDHFSEDVKILAKSDLDLFNLVCPYLFMYLTEYAVSNIKLIKLLVSCCFPTSLRSYVMELSTNNYEIIGDHAKEVILQSLEWDSMSQYCLWCIVNAEFYQASDFLIEHIPSILDRIDVDQHAECLVGLQQFLALIEPSRLITDAILFTPFELDRFVVSVLTRWALCEGDRTALLCKSIGQTLGDLIKNRFSDTKKKIFARRSLMHLFVWYIELKEEIVRSIFADTPLRSKIVQLIKAYELQTEFSVLLKMCQNQCIKNYKKPAVKKRKRDVDDLDDPESANEQESKYQSDEENDSFLAQRNEMKKKKLDKLALKKTKSE